MSKCEENAMDTLTTEMMEHLCDNLCKHPNRVGISQEELDGICAECKIGQFVCGILNEYNRLNDFEKTQSYKLLQNISKLESELQIYRQAEDDCK